MHTPRTKSDTLSNKASDRQSAVAKEAAPGYAELYAPAQQEAAGTNPRRLRFVTRETP